MVQLCSKCSRPNPGEAVYCYFDGFALSGSGGGGPVAVGAQAFVSPFVFPSGRNCRNFNDLALACQEDWKQARELLKEGYLETFFSGIGRVDLVMAARQAGKFPDADRGLDQLLEKLPANVMEAPKLRLEPQELSLGTVTDEEDRTVELHVENQGMRLLYGEVVSDTPWLALGEGAGVREKHFQCLHDVKIPVRIVNSKLRAGKPVEGKLVVATNGGSATFVVRAERPVKPFPSGVLAGAKTPRQVCATAKERPKEALSQFENGDVAAWYRSNGWTYPVQGPVATGMAAIQQFYEALGVTQPPKVEINLKAIDLEGAPGDTLTAAVEVRTQEKKAVYAHAVSDADWVEPAQAKLSGRAGTISLTVRVPNQPGETAQAKLTVHANGSQRFTVPVRVQVSGQRLELPPGRGDYATLEPVDVLEPADPFTELEAAPAAVLTPVLEAEPEPVARGRVRAGSKPDVALQPTVVASASPTVVSEPVVLRGGPARYRRDRGTAPWVHALPAVLLGLAIFGVVLWDVLTPSAKGTDANPEQSVEGAPPDPKTNPTPPAATGTDGWHYTVKDPTPVLSLKFNPESRFGLALRGVADPAHPGELKRLTREQDGGSNNTMVRINGIDYYYGRELKGHRVWLKKPAPLGLPRLGVVSAMHYLDEDVVVTQHVELVPGSTGKLDTCLVYYKIENRNPEAAAPVKVGLRVMVDTMIGGNDGVPFTIPGEKGFLDRWRLFSEKEIPDYVEAIERPESPADPGTVARLGLKGLRLPGVDVLENPHEMFIGQWESSSMPYDDFLKALPDKDKPYQQHMKFTDSCVVVYWADRMMNARETRHMAFTYGLSSLDPGSVGGTPPTPAMPQDPVLALRAPTSVLPGSDFIMTAYAWNGKPGEVVKLNLPDGIQLAPGETLEKRLEAGGKRDQVSWKLKAGARPETYPVEATLDKVKAKQDVVVRKTSIFG